MKSILRSIFMVLLSLVFIVSTKAQNELSKEDFGAIADNLRKEFISKLEDIPTNFSPKSLTDFTPYYRGDMDLKKVEEEYLKQILFVHQRKSKNEEMTLQEFFGAKKEENKYPPCFDKFYKAYANNLEATTEACTNITGNYATSIAKGALKEYYILNDYNRCIEKTYKE